MNEIDYQELSSAIDDFEKTIAALKRIQTASDSMLEAGQKIEKLCSDLNAASSQVTEKLENAEQSLDKFDHDFQDSAGKLLSVKAEIIVENEKARQNAASQHEETLLEFSKVSDALSAAQHELTGKTASAAKEVCATIDSRTKRIESQLDKISYSLTSIRAFKEDLEAIKKQELATKNLVLLGSVAACIAAIAAVVGLFV